MNAAAFAPAHPNLTSLCAFDTIYRRPAKCITLNVTATASTAVSGNSFRMSVPYTAARLSIAVVIAVDANETHSSSHRAWSRGFIAVLCYMRTDYYA
eukprot:5590693-Pleurochrysis_carterae.AAC.2